MRHDSVVAELCVMSALRYQCPRSILICIFQMLFVAVLSTVALQANLEEARAQSVSAPSVERFEELEANIARLLEERAELVSEHDAALGAQQEKRAELEAAQEAAIGTLQDECDGLRSVHDEVVRALEATVVELKQVVESKETEATELFKERDVYLAESKTVGQKAHTAAAALAAAEENWKETEQKLAAAVDTVGWCRFGLAGVLSQWRAATCLSFVIRERIVGQPGHVGFGVHSSSACGLALPLLRPCSFTKCPQPDLPHSL